MAKERGKLSWSVVLVATFVTPIGLSAWSSPTSRFDPAFINKETASFCEAGKSPPPLPLPSVAATVQRDIPVLVYHHINDNMAPSSEVMPKEMFRKQIEWLVDNGYKTVSLKTMNDYMMGKPVVLPEKPVMITFDDGWKDNLEAAEFLDEVGLGAVFYIISNSIEDPQYLNASEIHWIAKRPNFEIGSHTHTHFGNYANNMANLDNCTIAKELLTSKKVLEKVAGKQVDSLAWPYGYSNPNMITIASKLGFTSTMNINTGQHNVPGNSPLFAKRSSMNGACSLKDFSSVLTNVIQRCI